MRKRQTGETGELKRVSLCFWGEEGENSMLPSMVVVQATQDKVRPVSNLCDLNNHTECDMSDNVTDLCNETLCE